MKGEKVNKLVILGSTLPWGEGGGRVEGVHIDEEVNARIAKPRLSFGKLRVIVGYLN